MTVRHGGPIGEGNKKLDELRRHDKRGRGCHHSQPRPANTTQEGYHEPVELCAFCIMSYRMAWCQPGASQCDKNHARRVTSGA